MKVVFHINQLAKWESVLSSINNLLASGSGQVKSIEVVAVGESVKVFVETNYLIPMHELTEKGILFSSCNNALVAHDINKEELPPFIQVVPAGVLRLVELQAADYAYIKP